MNRKLKALGVVLAAMLAASVLSTSTASAAEFHAGAAPISLSGVQGVAQVLTTSAGTVTCPATLTFSGEMPVTTTKQITLIPTYPKCTAFGFIGVPIHANGCAYLFTSIGEAHVKCPSGKSIEITTPGCTTKIGAQTSLLTTSYSNNAGETDLIITTNLSGISYEECGTARTNGTLKGTATVTGANEKGTPIDVWFE